MFKEDFVIQSNVRHILIRSNIDYSRVTFGTVKDVVYVRGAFKWTFQRISRPEGKWDDLS